MPRRRESWCPACANGPMRRAGAGRVACPSGCILDARGYSYFALVSGDDRPDITEDVAKLDLTELKPPAYLGLIVPPSAPPLLCHVAQTAEQALGLLRMDYDLRKVEPCVVALWSCRAWQERAA